MLYNTFPGFGTENPDSFNLKQPQDFRRQSRKKHHRSTTPPYRGKPSPSKYFRRPCSTNTKKRPIRHKPPQKPFHRTRKKQPDDSRQTALYSYLYNK